jgi:hypothetical protein
MQQSKAQAAGCLSQQRQPQQHHVTPPLTLQQAPHALAVQHGVSQEAQQRQVLVVCERIH